MVPSEILPVFFPGVSQRLSFSNSRTITNIQGFLLRHLFRFFFLEYSKAVLLGVPLKVSPEFPQDIFSVNLSVISAEITPEPIP